MKGTHEEHLEAAKEILLTHSSDKIGIGPTFITQHLLQRFDVKYISDETYDYFWNIASLVVFDNS